MIDGGADCSRLALQAGVPLVPREDPGEHDLLLEMAEGRLSLRNIGDKPGTGIRVDFRDPSLPSRAELLKQPLVRSMGPVDGRLVDATAGLGGDSFLLAVAGWSVLCIERDAIVASLLADGIERADKDPAIAGKLRGGLVSRHGDSIELLEAIEPVEVIYIDPMYPRDSSSTIGTKQMRLLRRLVGDDVDGPVLLERARNRATSRVVVKRPPKAEPLGDGRVGSVAGKLARFDIHVPIG